MTRYARLLGLFAVIVLISSSPDAGTAQEKKGSKKSTEAKGGYVEVKETKSGKFYFSIRTAEGKFLAGGSPAGVADREEVERVLEQIRAALATGKIQEAKKSSTKKTDAK